MVRERRNRQSRLRLEEAHRFGGCGLDCQALDGAKILCGTNAIMLQPPKGGCIVLVIEFDS